jgi:hypothetical protein
MSDQDPYGDPTRVDVPVTDATQAMPAVGDEPPTTPPPTAPPPGGEPPDRRPWILAGILAAIIVVGLLILLLGGGDDSASPDTTTTSTTLATTTTTASTTTTTAATTTTTTAPTTTTTSPPATVAPGLCQPSQDDPATTVQVMYQAYTLGDRGCAEQLVASNHPEAVGQLFDTPGTGGGWSFAGCSTEQDHQLCAYTFLGGATDFRVIQLAPDGWVVYEVFQVAD